MIVAKIVTLPGSHPSCSRSIDHVVDPIDVVMHLTMTSTMPSKYCAWSTPWLEEQSDRKGLPTDSVKVVKVSGIGDWT